MKKVLFLIYFIFTVSVTSFGQTKKEQIDLLYRWLVAQEQISITKK